MTENGSQEAQGIAVPADETPWSLQFFAAGLFIVGIFALCGMVLCAFHNRELYFDVAVVALFMSAGLFHCRPGWRIATLIIVPAYCMLIAPAVFYIWTRPYLREQDNQEEVGWVLVYSWLCIRFLFGVWCIWVLTRPAVRQAFARSQANRAGTDGAAEREC